MTNEKMDIADYDATHYNYEAYWPGREYEDRVERWALAKMLPETGGSLIDIGGGFGRHLKEYVGKYKELTLLDYSQENLDKARSFLDSRLRGNDRFVRGDVYDLPFPSDSFDAGMMVRVMHHLEEPQKALAEIYRVLKPGSVFVLEFANKCHFKALLQHGLKFCLDESPYNQLTKNSGVFLNYHPQMIKKIVTNLGWKIEEVRSVSNFRSPLLKRIVPRSILIKLDELLQKPLSTINFGPSIFLKLTR